MSSAQTFRLDRFRQIWSEIIANPALHDQANWHCDTSHCIAGHADLKAANYCTPPRSFNKLQQTKRWDKYQAKARVKGLFDVAARGADWLGLSEHSPQAEWLFSYNRTPAELSQLAYTGQFPRALNDYDEDSTSIDPVPGGRRRYALEERYTSDELLSSKAAS